MRHDRSTLLVLVVLVVVALDFLTWATLDARIPPDLARSWQGVAVLAEARDPIRMGTALLHPGGPGSAAYAVATAVLGVWGVHLLDLAAMLGLIAVTAALGRRLGGPHAAPTAAALVAAFPIVTVWGRLPWVHVPEAALALLALWAWDRDPRLSTRTLAVIAVSGALALWLRPSALVWIGLLWLGLARRRTLPVLAVWVVAAIPAMLVLPTYIQTKLDARARYAASLPTPWEEMPSTLGWLALVICVVGIGLWLGSGRARPTAIPMVLVGWLGAAAALSLSTHAGLFNHTLVGPALAVLAAAGLARWPAAGGIAGAALLGSIGTRWLPPTQPPPGPTPGTVRAADGPAPWSWHRPWQGPGAADVLALVDATCPPDAPCVLAATPSLFAPVGEEPGLFELAVAGRTDVELMPTDAFVDPKLRRVPDAVVSWDCPAVARPGDDRFDRADLGATQARDRHALDHVQGVSWGPDCTLQWATARPSNRAQPAD